MALSGSVSTSKYDGRYYTLSWTATQSIDKNTSTISWTLKAVGGASSWYAERTLKVVLGGSTVYSKTDRVQRYTGTVASGTKTITHNANGDASFSVSIQAAVYTSSVNCKGSGSFTLNTIPRASSFGTISGNTIGSGITININRNSSSFTHSLWYSFGSKTWQGIGSGIGTSKSFTPPLSLCSEVPSATSGTLTLILRTYNGSTQVGSDVYKSITLNVPSSVVPSISSISLSEATSGLASKFGCYVKNKSKLKVVVNASGSYSSTIKTYQTTIEGTNYSGSSFTSNVLRNSGTITITTKVTDSRGRTASKSTTITIVDYYAPSISKFTVQRCLSDGTLNDEGTYLKCVYSYAIAPVNSKNDKVVKIQYLNNSEWTDIATVTNGYSLTDATYIRTIEFSIDKSYQVRLQIIDYFTETSNSKTVSTSFALINHNESGKGIAFGKVSESDNFDVDMEAIFRKGFLTFQKNTISSTTDDTPANWCKYGNSVHWYDISGLLIDQPSQWGFLVNYVRGSDIHQLWFTQSTGNVCHRGGNGSGWNGTWSKILDSSNYSSYALPLTGGNVSGTANVSGVSAFNWVRFNNSWVGFYGSHANAINGTSRLGWIGHNDTTHLNITNEAGGNIILKSTGAQIDLTCKSGTVTLDYSDGSTYNGYFIPATTAKTTLGTTSYRWYGLYSSQACNTSSDERLKSNIIPMNSELATFLSGDNSNIFENIFSLLKPVAFSSNVEDGTEHEGRMHFGFIAQEVEKALEENGLDEKATSFVTHSFWTDEETGEEKDEYSLRYEEFIALNTHMIQKQQKEIDDLKKQIEELKTLVKGAQ